MDQHDVNRGTAQPPAKDFLALTHGQEWVNFYESFDKLVQDHLSRSSELLRKAMSLPEVADREVAQVRAEMEGKLAAERDRGRDILVRLRDEISVSHDQVSKLADDVKGVVADLASLSVRVSDALTALEKPAEAPPPAAVAFAAGEPQMPMLNGTVESVEATAQESESPADEEPSANGAGPDVDAIADEVPAMEAEADSPVTAESEVVAAAADAEVDAVTAAESSDDASLDLSAMAEAESSEEEVEASLNEELGTGELSETVAGGERPRPHWLSVTRIGTRP